MNNCIKCGSPLPYNTVCLCTEDRIVETYIDETMYDRYFDGYVYAPKKQYRMKDRMFMEFED